MQRTLTPEIPRVKDLEEIEFATARGPAAAVRVLAVLACEWDLGVHEPDCGHVGVEAGPVGRRHGEFEEEEFVRAGETV